MKNDITERASWASEIARALATGALGALLGALYELTLAWASYPNLDGPFFVWSSFTTLMAWTMGLASVACYLLTRALIRMAARS